MAVCGHCGKRVKGIRDHIKAQHGDQFYAQGPDNKYYGYATLRTLPGWLDPKPHWDVTYSPAMQRTFKMGLP